MKTHANCRTARSAHASVERSRNEHQSSKFSWAGIYRRALWLALAASIVWTGASLVPSGEQTVDAQGITPVAAAAADAPSYHYTTKPIEQIKEGDYVLARNPATGEIEKKRVEATFIRTCDHIRVLDFQAPNGDIQRHETTDEHPYYLPQLDTFVNAADLQPGDQVTGPNGERQRLIASTRRDEPDGITVYNFSVEDHRVYFVAGRDSGRMPVLVHNADKIQYDGLPNATKGSGPVRIPGGGYWVEAGDDLKPIMKKKIPKNRIKKPKDDIPDQYKQTPFLGESGKDFARRVLEEAGEYNPNFTGPGTLFNRLKKYADAHYEDPT